MHLVRWLSWLLPLLGLLVLAALVRPCGRTTEPASRGCPALSGRWVGGPWGRPRGWPALLVLAGFLAGRLDDDTLSGAVVQAVWGELDGDFWAAAGFSVRRLRADAPRAARACRAGPRARTAGAGGPRVEQVLDPGPGLAARTYRAVFVGLAGLALVLQPLALLRALLWAIGLVLLVTGIALFVPITVEVVREKVLRRVHERSPRWPWQRVAGATALVALLLVLVLGAWPTRDDEAAAFGHDDSTCNGYVALCDRPYDEVAFPATHNSMSAANEPGWFFAEQPDGIVAQLDDGIRVLLVDSWYGQRTQRPRHHRQHRRQPRGGSGRGTRVVRRGRLAQCAARARRPRT